jgi:hypothetical protein
MPMTNREFSEQDETFRQACKSAGVDASRRQASKWRRRVGRAWKYGRGRVTKEADHGTVYAG